MPVAAAAILQRIADFLAVGARPRASAEAGDGFSLLLARNAPALAASQPEGTGKALPLDRQDLAGQTVNLPASDVDQPSEPTTTTEQATATPAAETLPSTVAILTANGPAPILATVVTNAPAPSNTMPALPDAPVEGDEPASQRATPVPVTHQSAHTHQQMAAAPVGARPIISAATSIEPETEVAEATTPQTTPLPASASARPASAPKSAETPAPAKREHRIALDAKTPETLPGTREQAPAVAVTDIVTPLQPAAPSPAEAMASATPVEPALSATIAAPAADAAPVTNIAADVGTPSPAFEAKPRLAHADHPAIRTAPAERQPIHGPSAAPKLEEPTAEVVPTSEHAAAIPSPVTAMVSATPAMAAAAVPTHTNTAEPATVPAAVVVTTIPVRPETIAQLTPAAPQIRSADLPAAQAEQPAVTAAQPAAAQPAQGQRATTTAASQPATPIVTVVAPGAAPAATQASVTFVARPLRTAATRTQAPQPTGSNAPAAKTDTAIAQVAANAAAPAERNTLPFRATARQIVAAQPANADAPRPSEAETSIRTPLAETAPTIAQHLAPASHGGERIVATPMPTTNTALSTEQAAALVETIQMLRSEAKSDAMTLAIDHDELGRITMRFDRTDHGVAVRIDSPDPAVTQLIANAAPALRSSGDGVGMRFERQDASGSGAGTSRDTPRQGAGQDRNPTPYAQSSRPRSSGQRDGLFA